MTWQYLPTSLFFPAGRGATLRRSGSGGGDVFVTSNTTPTLSALSGNESPMDSLMTHQSGATSEPLMESPGLDLWMESLRVFRASPSAQPGSEWEPKTIEICGRIPFALLERSAPGSFFLRTSLDYLAQWIKPQRTLFGTSESYWETWPKAGMMQDGVCYPLKTWEHHIRDEEYGLWPTPTYGDVELERRKGNLYKTKTGSVRAMNENGVSSNRGLPGAVLCPTPNARDYKGEPGKAWSSQSSLPAAISKYPTPSATDYRTGYGDTAAARKQHAKRKKPLRDSVAQSMKLNPPWDEWLMGWPIGWTSLDPLPLEVFADWLDRFGAEWWQSDPADIPYAPTNELIPRAITHKLKDRVPRIRCIGNGQVPAAAAAAWELMVDGGV